MDHSVRNGSLKLLQESVDKFTNDEILGINDALSSYGECMMSTKDRDAMLEHWIAVGRRNSHFAEWLGSLFNLFYGPEVAEAFYLITSNNGFDNECDKSRSFIGVPDRSNKKICYTLFTRNCIAVLLFLVVGVLIISVSLSLYRSYLISDKPNYHRMIVSENNTVIVATYPSMDDSTVVIKESILNGDASHVCDVLALPASLLKYHWRVDSESVNITTLNNGDVIVNEMYMYLIKDSVISFNICLGSISQSPNASLYIFNNDTHFIDYLSYSVSSDYVYQASLSVGNSGQSICTNISYTVPGSGHYYVASKAPLKGTKCSYTVNFNTKYLNHNDYLDSTLANKCVLHTSSNCSFDLKSPDGSNIAILVYTHPTVVGSKINHLDVSTIAEKHVVATYFFLFWCFLSLGVCAIFVGLFALLCILCVNLIRRKKEVRYHRVPTTNIN
jgi:hypothetical protein